MTVGLGVLDINLLVGHVQVATQDDGLLLVELLQVLTEVILPRHAVVQAFQAVLRVGRVAANQIELLHFQRQHTAFMVVEVDADAPLHADGLVAGKDGCARIAFLVGVVPVAVVAGEL